LTGFADTARAVAQLDLVISVDTAMAHLTGAMGRFAWVLLPWSADPRWLSAGPLSPWYPRLRLFRQPRPGDWHGAVDQLLDTFKSGHFAAGKAP
jgi:ADP-heptose:LPS heptosyltransferase